MNSKKEDIESALLDVRKAYRLLHDYQRMALDAVNFIGKQFGLIYEGGYPRFSEASPRAGKGKLEKRAWDWLNMMFYEFHFYRVFGNEWVGFSILLISDTGYCCVEDDQGDPTNTSSFQPSERAATKVGFVMTANDWPEGDLWSEKFLNNKAAMKTFLENNGELPENVRATGMIGKCCDFSRLVNEDETLKLIEELVVEANRAGIKLKRITMQE